MFVKITGPESGDAPYTWQALFPAPEGKWTEGGIGGTSAYEVNGRRVKIGTIVFLHSMGQHYVFFHELTKPG